MNEKDRAEVIDMMNVFYSSDAVYTNGSVEIFENDFYACISHNPYLEGYVFVDEDNIAGYVMLAKSYSTEFGKQCIWIEDLYIKEQYRGQGIGTLFFEFIESIYNNVLFRLEVEDANIAALSLYKKCGFEVLPYKEMMKSVK
jgi:ribosomal protein S18 acetylase RimI-like enzyme